MAAVAELPFLGAGVSFRPEWRWDVIRHRAELGLLEIIADDVVGPAGQRELLLLRDALPLLLHGIGLSLGSADGLDPARVDHFAQLVEIVRPPWVSEHIAFTRVAGVDIGHLTPLPFTREAIDTVARNVETLRSAVPNVPILLENIAYTFLPPGQEMSEAEFVRGVITTCDCGLLLDLENVHANARNHGYDPIEYLESLPLERAVEVHLAGGVEHDGIYADTHSRPVPEESWTLLQWLVTRTSLRAVIIERDNDLPRFEELLTEVSRASRMLHAHAR
ncbi:MAG: DUF692 domain-containing protein [Gemmatimonadota bacterium]